LEGLDASLGRYPGRASYPFVVRFVGYQTFGVDRQLRLDDVLPFLARVVALPAVPLWTGNLLLCRIYEVLEAWENRLTSSGIRTLLVLSWIFLDIGTCSFTKSSIICISPSTLLRSRSI
jgi:hypothetical protein